MRADHWSLTVVALVALAACEPDEVVPFAPVFDSGSERADTGPIRPPADAGRDTGLEDGGGLDGGDGGGVVPPVIDGVIGADEWEGAIEATSSTTPAGLFASDRLERLLAIRTDERLYLAIEGALGADHAFLLLLDDDFGSGEGLVLTGSLSDFEGALDLTLSTPSWGSLLPDFRPEYAWGTTMVPFARGAADAEGGWRAIGSASGQFVWLGSGSVSVCTVDHCETSIALDGSGLEGAGEIAVAVRIGRSDGLLSNQTLPMDLPSTAEIISQVMRIPAR